MKTLKVSSGLIRKIRQNENHRWRYAASLNPDDFETHNAKTNELGLRRERRGDSGNYR